MLRHVSCLIKKMIKRDKLSRVHYVNKSAITSGDLNDYNFEIK